MKSSYIFVECVAETVENDDVSVLEKEAAETVKNSSISSLEKEAAEAMSSSNSVFNEEAAWMLIMMLRNNHILVRNAVKIMKSSSINAFNEKVTFILDK